MQLKDKQNTFKKIINPWTLLFKSRELEKQFKNEYFAKSINSFRVSFIIVIIFYGGFGVLDYYTSHNFYSEFSIVRFLIVIPTLFTIWLCSYHPKFKNVWQILISCCYLLAGMGISYMLLRNPANIFYYGGIFLIFIAGYFFIKLYFIWAVIPGIILILFYNLGAIFFNTQDQISIEQLYATDAFFISANIIAVIALYNSKLIERKEFHHRILLSEQQHKIETINENLEAKVVDRTQLLEHRNKILKAEINTRNEIEKKLLQSKIHAEESDRLKSAFLANMSHEIRTPMNGIIGFLDLVSDPELTRDEQDQYLEIVKQSGNRLLQTINDIIELSKIEAGELSENISEVSLEKTFKYISEFFSLDIAEKNIELRLPQNALNFSIKTDNNKLESILMNLIKNAIKFTDEGFIEIGIVDEGNKLKFIVKDTGQGIPQDRQKAVYDRFVQADLSLTRGHEGSGLGLSICKAYVEIMGGEIWLESEINKGTTFYFTIKHMAVNTTNTEINEKSHFSQSASKKQQETIALVAEDDDVSYSLIQTILSNEHITPIHAKNGLEAVNIFKSHGNISIIIMDIKMPIMDGIKATSEIRKLDKNIPIIAQTAFALSGDKEIAMQAGCSDYLSKPLKRNDLLSTIKKFLDHPVK